jgi:hypothetical protein
VTTFLDAAQQLVAEDEPVLARRRDAEEALGDLPVRAADADLERADQELATRGSRRGHLGDRGAPVHAGGDDESLHQARRTAPSAAEPTWAR